MVQTEKSDPRATASTTHLFLAPCYYANTGGAEIIKHYTRLKQGHIFYGHVAVLNIDFTFKISKRVKMISDCPGGQKNWIPGII